ncbi:MAG: helix-turn-helix transcriptional regulator [Prolixibacteraceae bacterium]|nr:helix-turn-helix transcriptional regulator [Prolixibacteraceae bacterium]
MKERIIKFIEAENLSAAEFADRIGVQRSSVSHVLNGRNNPGFSFIQKILDQFPKLDARWLLTGEGRMHRLIDPPASKNLPADNLFNFNQTDELQTSQKQPESKIDPTIVKDKRLENSPAMPVTNAQNEEKKVSRVLIFYEDHTFEDFRPAK